MPARAASPARRAVAAEPPAARSRHRAAVPGALVGAAPPTTRMGTPGRPADRATWVQIWMDTAVLIQLAVPAAAAKGYAGQVARAFAWFQRVEAACSRFERASEVRRLACRVGEPVRVSVVVSECLRFALALAEATGGAFDPTVGGLLEARGFDRNYRTGRRVDSGIDHKQRPTFRDVRHDPVTRTVTLRRPLLLDLGAVAKGLAADLALRELAGLPGAAVDAGGDCAVHGRTETGAPWRIGVRHPRRSHALLGVLQATEGAVCTSGGYERAAPAGGHHIIDPRTGGCPAGLISTTVLAPTAMAADALSTAAMLLGPTEGLRLLEACRVDGLLVTARLEVITTPGFERHVGGYWPSRR